MGIFNFTFKDALKKAGVKTVMPTPDEMRAIIKQLNDDPLAGMGIHSKAEKFIDIIVARQRIAEAEIRGIPLKGPVPFMMDEDIPEDPASKSTVALNAARAAKAAGL